MKEFIVTVHDVRTYRVRMRDKFAKHEHAAADEVSEPARGDASVQMLAVEQWSTTRRVGAKRRRK